MGNTIMGLAGSLTVDRPRERIDPSLVQYQNPKHLGVGREGSRDSCQVVYRLTFYQIKYRIRRISGAALELPRCR